MKKYMIKKEAILKKIEPLNARMIDELEKFIDYLNYKQRGEKGQMDKGIAQKTFGSIKVKDLQLAKYIAEDKELEYEL